MAKLGQCLPQIFIVFKCEREVARLGEKHYGTAFHFVEFSTDVRSVSFSLCLSNTASRHDYLLQHSTT